jgi:hypothetical protein
LSAESYLTAATATVKILSSNDIKDDDKWWVRTWKKKFVAYFMTVTWNSPENSDEMNIAEI